MPLVDVFEQRLSSTKDDQMYDEPELVDQAPVHQTADQPGTADGVHVLAGVLFICRISSMSRTIRVRSGSDATSAPRNWALKEIGSPPARQPQGDRGGDRKLP
jgi:hypothetical protein